MNRRQFIGGTAAASGILLLNPRTAVCAEPEHSLPADIDASVIPPDIELYAPDSTPSTVATSTLGAYRVLGSKYLDRMAYLFQTTNVTDFIKLTISYPDNAARNAELFTFSEADQNYGMTSLGTGYFTGDPYPITNRMIRQTFYFYTPGSVKFAVVLMTAAPGRPAAVARIQVEKVDPNRPLPMPGEASKPGRRKIGMYWEDMVFQQNFSVYAGEWVEADAQHAQLFVSRMTAAQRLTTFKIGLDRHVLYMKQIGHNMVIDPVVWYTTALFQPSAEYSAKETAIWGSFRPPNFDQLMADRYSKEGFDYWPSVRSWMLPSLLPSLATVKGPLTVAEVQAGTVTEYVNAVDKDGKVITRSAWHNPPMLNALHPRVQTALKNLVADIMERIGSYSSVRGIALWATIHSSQGLGTIEQSFDDYTVNQFAQDMHIALPAYNGPPEGRFNNWYQWLRAEHWKEWIAWRKQKQTQLYYALADIIAAKNPAAKLNLMLFSPAPTLFEGLTVDNVGAFLDGVGIDVDALATNPHITITRMIVAHEYQHQCTRHATDSPGMQSLFQRSILDFSPAWQRPFLGKTAGAVIHYTYFEHPMKNLPKMHPTGWRASEPNWHVTSPKAAGQNALEYLARSIALLDPMFLAYGGYQMGPQGLEETVPSLVKAFTSLPAVPFTTQSPQNGVVVRRAAADGFQWTYAVNATAKEQKVDLGSGPVIIQPWELLVSKKVRRERGIL